MRTYHKETQKFATFGDKLLQHTDVLSEIQNSGHWKPINIQISPIAACDSYCDFCSVSRRDLKHKLSFEQIKKVLYDFRCLGAKAVEFTGGGNPMIHPDINKIIAQAWTFGYDIGMISNTENPGKILNKDTANMLTWYRCSLTKLEEGKTVEDFNFSIIPKGKLGFSHIMNIKTKPEIIENIAKLVDKNPEVKFVRIAGNCLDGDSIESVKKDWGKHVEKYDKFFIKEIGGRHNAYPNFCGVGPIRPYVYDDGYIYICTSHVLKFRKVDPRYRIGHIGDIKGMYKKMDLHFKNTGRPYDIDIKGKCSECFYYNNNQLLHTIVQGYGKSRHGDANFA